jgi:hypothetical protein
MEHLTPLLQRLTRYYNPVTRSVWHKADPEIRIKTCGMQQ